MTSTLTRLHELAGPTILWRSQELAEVISALPKLVAIVEAAQKAFPASPWFSSVEGKNLAWKSGWLITPPVMPLSKPKRRPPLAATIAIRITDRVVLPL